MVQWKQFVECISGPPEDSIFTYDLAPVALAVFYDDDIVRMNTKSLLMQYLLNLATDSRETQGNFKAVVFDGGALIHRLPWPKVGTMETVCGMYVDLVTRSNSSDVSVTSNISVLGNKTAFLSNQGNKQFFINILGRSLERDGITVVHAKDMGDADVTIIKETLTLAEAYKCVQVVGDDTDIFICLLFYSIQDIIIRTKRDCINVRKVQKSLRKSLIDCLLFAHSVSGCHTTPSFYGIGKMKAVKLPKELEVLQ